MEQFKKLFHFFILQKRDVEMDWFAFKKEQKELFCSTCPIFSENCSSISILNFKSNHPCKKRKREEDRSRKGKNMLWQKK